MKTVSGSLRSHFTVSGKPKKVYETYTDAVIAAESQNRLLYEGYECDICGKFHIGRKRG